MPTQEQGELRLFSCLGEGYSHFCPVMYAVLRPPLATLVPSKHLQPPAVRRTTNDIEKLRKRFLGRQKVSGLQTDKHGSDCHSLLAESMVSTRTGLANSRSKIEHFKTVSDSSMVVHACNPSSEE